VKGARVRSHLKGKSYFVRNGSGADGATSASAKESVDWSERTGKGKD